MPSAAPTADTPFLSLPERPAPWPKPRRRFALCAGLLLIVAGCNPKAPVEALEVLNYGHCVGLEAGATVVRYADLARIRGGEMMDPGTPSPAELDESVALVAIYRGPQPTPGYGFTVLSASRSGDSAEVVVRWSEPPPDAVLAQVITNPCLVVALPRNGLQHVEIVDASGDRLASVAINP